MTLRSRGALGRAVGVSQIALLLNLGDPGHACVGRITQNDQNRRGLLHFLGLIALLGQFQQPGECVLHGGLGRVRRCPAGQGVGQVDTHALAFVQGRTELLEQQPDLEVRDHEGRGQQLEAEDAGQRRPFHILTEQGVCTVRLERGRNLAQDFGHIRAGAGTRVKHIDTRVSQTIGHAQFRAKGCIHTRHHITHHLGRRIPDPQFLA